MFILTGLGEALALPMGVLGAWIGSGQVADVAGFAALQTLDNESALRSYTLVKVIGRDLSVAVWSFIMATIAVTRWSSVSHDEEVHHSVLARIWYRFPKFVIGLFLASIITAFVIHLLPGEFLNDYHKSVLGTLKNYRSWFFTLCFLCIGLNTNIKDLKDVGWKAFFAFTVGILVLVLVGYILSAYIFLDFWQSI